MASSVPHLRRGAKESVRQSGLQGLRQHRHGRSWVFDNLGAEKLADWVEEQFYLLVDYRYRQRLAVMASSNCWKEALAQRLDRRVMDRLRETCAMLEVVGPNQRDRAVLRR